MKTPIIIEVEGGAVKSIDSPGDLNILVLDYDRDNIQELSCSRLTDTARDYNWSERVKEIRAVLKFHDIDPEDFKDVLRDCPKPEIHSIEIQHYHDETADYDMLGDFKNRIDDEGLQRHSAFKWEEDRNSLDFFIPANSVEDHRAGLCKLGYSRQVSEELARKYCREDFERMKALNRGDWFFIGIRTTALVRYPVDDQSMNYRVERFDSCGLWGVESDSSEAYLKEIEQEELDNLKSHLESFGIDTSKWAELAPEPQGELDNIKSF